MATRILAAWYYVGRDKTQVPTNFHSWDINTFGFEHAAAKAGYDLINEHVDVRADHGASIRIQAARSTVLLKNDGCLPLTGKEKFTGIFGKDAAPSPLGPNGCPDRGCDDGTLGEPTFCWNAFSC